MNADPDNPLLEAEIQCLEEALELQRSEAQRRSRTLLIMSAAIAMVACGLLLSSYLQVRSSWTEDKFTESLAREAERLTPMAVAELMVLGQNLLPVYAQASRDEFLRRRPAIEAAISEELDAFFVTLSHDARKRLVGTAENIRDGAAEELLALFPDLHDPDARERLVLSFVAMTDHAFREAVDDFVARYTSDVDAFNDELARFDVVGSDYTTAELQKRLVHLWLQALDEEVMSL